MLTLGGDLVIFCSWFGWICTGLRYEENIELSERIVESLEHESWARSTARKVELRITQSSAVTRHDQGKGGMAIMTFPPGDLLERRQFPFCSGPPWHFPHL